MARDTDRLSFWEHLDEFRSVLLKIVSLTGVFGLAAFLFKEELFAVVFAPKEADFITYRLLRRIGGSGVLGETAGFDIPLINTGLAEQFIIHMKTALCAGVLCASPYILYQLFRFVSPALYELERRYAWRTVSSGYLLFLLGAAVSYFILFPLTFRFLGTYQVSSEVANLISLQSYMGTLLGMCLAMGLVFELPVLAWLFAKLGFISAGFMQRYRRHAIVLILIAAAIITPTSDIFTLSIVSLPMWLLYEASILLVGTTAK